MLCLFFHHLLPLFFWVVLSPHSLVVFDVETNLLLVPFLHQFQMELQVILFLQELPLELPVFGIGISFGLATL